MTPKDSLQTQRPSMTSLLKGIVEDAKDLFIYELTAIKLEITEELQNEKNKSLLLVGGVVASTVGGVLLALMLVHLLDLYSDVPLWGCYGLIGSIVTLIGLMICTRGKSR